MKPVFIVALLCALASQSALAEKHRVFSEHIYFEPGKGLTFDSVDKAFRVRFKPRGQLRYEIDDNDDGNLRHALILRRVRLTMTGHLFSKLTPFKFELAASPKDLGVKDNLLVKPIALDFYVDSTHLRDLNARVGQYKMFYSRQRFLSSAELQLVDRSIAQAEFNLDRDLGITLFSKDLFGLNRIRYFMHLGTGKGRDLAGPEPFGLLYAARVEVSPFGHQKGDNKTVDFARRSFPSLSIAGAYAYIHKSAREKGPHGSFTSDGGTTSSHNLTGDVLFKWYGVSILSEVYLRDATREDVPADAEASAPRNGWGGFVQGGYLMPFAPVEVSARYSTIIPASENTKLTTQNELGVGLSYYFMKHIVKVQGDYFRKYGDSFGEDVVNEGRLQLEYAF